MPAEGDAASSTAARPAGTRSFPGGRRALHACCCAVCLRRRPYRQARRRRDSRQGPRCRFRNVRFRSHKRGENDAEVDVYLTRTLVLDPLTVSPGHFCFHKALVLRPSRNPHHLQTFSPDSEIKSEEFVIHSCMLTEVLMVLDQQLKPLIDSASIYISYHRFIGTVSYIALAANKAKLNN